MGMTKVLLKIKNPRNPSKIYEGEFLVDSGASYTVVPGKELKKIGVEPVDEEKFTLADGKIISRKVGNVFYEYEGIERAAPVLFGEKDDALLLGVFTLEAMGLTLDPFKRKLYKSDLHIYSLSNRKKKIL